MVKLFGDHQRRQLRILTTAIRGLREGQSLPEDRRHLDDHPHLLLCCHDEVAWGMGRTCLGEDERITGCSQKG